MNEYHPDEAFKPTVSLIAEELTLIERQIEEHETKLATLKALRTRGQRLLAILDPTNAKPKRKRDSNTWTVSDKMIKRITQGAHDMNGNGSFNAQEMADLTGVNVTTVNKTLKILHDRGVIRLDHMGGQRNTTKFYAVVD